MSRTIASNENIESMAIELVSRYPTGFLSDPELMLCDANPWAAAICHYDANGLNTPRAIFRGSCLDIRTFEMAYHRVKGMAN